MPSPLFSIVFSAPVSGVAASGAAGDVLIVDAATGLFSKATTAVRGTRRATGIALTAYSGGGVVEIQQEGLVDATTAGLGAGLASYVRTSTTGTLERVVSPGATDDVVGWVETDGTLHLRCGQTPGGYGYGAGGGGGTPGGSNTQVQYNGAGSFAGASVLTTDGASYVAIGATTVAASGLIRRPSATSERARNAANSADVVIAETDASDILWLGQSSAGASQAATTRIGGTSGVQFYTAGSVAGYINAAVLQAPAVQVGAAPSATGALRIPTTTGIRARNAGNTSDVAIAETDASDNLWVGQSSAGTLQSANTKIGGAAGVQILVNGTQAASVTATTMVTPATIQLGPVPAATGIVRLGTSPSVRSRNNANTADIAILETDASNYLYIGTDVTFSASLGVDTVRIDGRSQVIIGCAGTRSVTASGQNSVLIGLPALGDPSNGSPWSGCNGLAVLAMADANQTASSSVYQMTGIRTTGTLTANRNLTLPTAPSDAYGYPKWINNFCAGAFGVVVKCAAGITVTVANGKSAWVWVDSIGVSRMTADV